MQQTFMIIHHMKDARLLLMTYSKLEVFMGFHQTRLMDGAQLIKVIKPSATANLCLDHSNYEFIQKNDMIVYKYVWTLIGNFKI